MVISSTVRANNVQAPFSRPQVISCSRLVVIRLFNFPFIVMFYSPLFLYPHSRGARR